MYWLTLRSRVASYFLKNSHGIDAEAFTPLNELRHIQTSIALLDAPYVAVRTFKPPCELSLGYPSRFPGLNESRRQPPVPRCPQLF